MNRVADFDTTTLLYSWSRDFSQQRVITASITFSSLMSDYEKYQRTISRPLFVVLLDTREAMSEFVKVMKNVNPISFPAWLIMFLQHPGKPLEKYCLQPVDNMFNVDFNTLMLVLCYDHQSLFEWYAIHDNRTRMFELATWTADGSLSFRTQKNLYARRSDMFGDIVRVASVNVSCFNVEKLLLYITIFSCKIFAMDSRLAQFVIKSILEFNDTHPRHQPLTID